jgi:very-short-patch-repair endonuclease
MTLNRSPKLLAVTVKYAKQLRKNQTKTEKLLWEELRERKLKGWRFQRQRPMLIELRGVGTFAVADFYCAKAKLVIEIDGSVHDEQESEDKARDLALAKRGYDVMRIPAADVLQHLEQVLKRIDDQVTMRVQARRGAKHIPPSLALREGGIEGG